MSARDLVEEFGLNKDHCSLLRELCNGRAASSLMSGGGRACENNKENKLLLEELQTAGLVSRLAVTPSKKEIRFMRHSLVHPFELAAVLRVIRKK